MLWTKIPGAIFAVILCVTQLHFTAVAQPLDPKTLRIIGGDEISQLNSPVVQVIRGSGAALGFCSGSVLTSRAVLTAFHCVSKRAALMKVVIAGRLFLVRKVRIHPRARFDSRSQAVLNDVAILILRRSTRQPKAAILVSSPVQVNDVLTIAGYGIDEFGMVGILRAGTTSVQQVSKDAIVTVFDPATGSDTCNGDSGGPAIKSYLDAQNILRSGIVGVTSSGTSLTCSPGDLTSFPNLQSPSMQRFLKREVKGLKLE